MGCADSDMTRMYLSEVGLLLNEISQEKADVNEYMSGKMLNEVLFTTIKR